jgi:hypothetical protein
MRSYISGHVAILVLILAASAVVHGQQQPPPIDGVTGLVAVEGTTEQTYARLNVVLVKTAGGIHHFFHLAGRTVAHAASGTAKAVRSVTPYTRKS